MLFSAHRLLQNDALIWLLATLYGAAAGALSYVATLDQFFGNWAIAAVAVVMNFPSFMVFMALFGGSSIPPAVYPVIMIAGSAAVWSLAGLAAYGFVELFRLGP